MRVKQAIPGILMTGLLNTVLKGQGAGAVPIFERPQLSDHGLLIGNFIRNSAGNEVVTGVGFRPSLVIFITTCTSGAELNWSHGYDILTQRMCQYTISWCTASSTTDLWSIWAQSRALDEIHGNITAFSNDGFTVTFIMNGNATVNVYYLAIG